MKNDKMDQELKENYYDKTIKTYNESGYEEIPEQNFPAWESFLIPYLKDGSYILDLGCGSGIYSQRFKTLGYKVRAVDGAKSLCKHASRLLNQEVRCLRFTALEDKNEYDAVFACASILHAPSQDYPDIFQRVYCALKEQGYFYLSFIEGNHEGYQEDREAYITEMTEASMRRLLKEVGLFKLVAVARTPFPNNKEAYWIHFVLQKKLPSQAE